MSYKHKKGIKCVLPKNNITYKCVPTLQSVWKNIFKGQYKTKKYKTYFKLNNKVAILDTDKDTSLTQLIYNNKKQTVNLEVNPYKVLIKIKRLLSK